MRHASSSSGLGDVELRSQNSHFAGTGGVSPNNRAAGFVPAYLNTATGDTVVSRFADGRAAPVHLLEGLPDPWVLARDAKGQVARVSDAVVAGFLYRGRFYTREAAAQALSGAFAEVAARA